MPNIINKVVYDGNVLIDLTSDTVTAGDVLQGVTVHLADGTVVTGTMIATSTPTADTISKFDSSAKMNSTDMSSADVSSFVAGLNTGVSDYIQRSELSTYTSYSNTEAFTGATWVNGKYIYKKTLSYNNTAISNNVSINHNIAGIDKIIKIEGHLDDNGHHISIPSTTNNSANDLGIRANTTTIQFVGNDSWGASATRTVYVTLWYTKT